MSQSPKDYSKYDDMSTKNLEDLLRADFEANDRSSDMDKILYIMEVIAKRKKNSGEYPNAERSWKSFQRKYLADNNASFHELEDTPKKTDIQMPLKKKQRKSRFFVGIVAAMIVIVCGSGLKAQGFGHNLWDIITQWTSETFGFGQESENQQAQGLSQTYNSLQEALNDYDIKEKIAPTKIPESCSLVSVDVTESKTVTNFAAFYQGDDDYILITVNHIQDYTYTTYEKDDGLIETFEMNGIKHYLFSNLDSNTVAWMNGANECSISSSLPPEELKVMVQSIYER